MLSIINSENGNRFEEYIVVEGKVERRNDFQTIKYFLKMR